MDLYLDSSTFLPVSITFSIHPDNNALLDVPVEVHFSDYRKVSGVQVAFHVQKFISNQLTLDVSFQTVSLNTGLSTTDFAVQQ
jgi:hypothetical protein